MIKKLFSLFVGLFKKNLKEKTVEELKIELHNFLKEKNAFFFKKKYSGKKRYVKTPKQ